MRSVFSVLLVCLLGLGNSAHAIPVTFDFSLNGSQELLALSFLEEGLRLDISASDDRGVDAFINQNADGLGVYRSGSDAKSLDGYGVDDLLILSFSTVVELAWSEFSSLEAGDSFSLSFGSGEKYQPGWIDELFLFEKGKFVGDLFVFSAEEDRADYRIKSITVDYVATPIPAPEPGSWLLLSAGICAWFCFRRRS